MTTSIRGFMEAKLSGEVATARQRVQELIAQLSEAYSALLYAETMYHIHTGTEPPTSED